MQIVLLLVIAFESLLVLNRLAIAPSDVLTEIRTNRELNEQRANSLMKSMAVLSRELNDARTSMELRLKK